MTDNVTVREPEVAQDQSSHDRSDRQPVATEGRAEPPAPAEPVAPAASDQVTTADMAAAGAAPSDAPAARRGEVAAAAQPDRDMPTRRGTERDAPGDGGATAPLFGGDQASTYRSRWQEIQTGFVDEPRAAVQEADALVADVMRQLARTFADERRGLEGQWAEGEEISTEDLRIALRRYRSFFDRLLSV
jgi:hypothetical protein